MRRNTALTKLREALGQVQLRVDDGSPIAQVQAHLNSAIKLADHLIRAEAETLSATAWPREKKEGS